LDGLEAVRAEMHEAPQRHLVKRGAERFLAGVRGTRELHRDDLFARVRMRLDLVTVAVPVDDRLRHQLQILRTGDLVAPGPNLESVIELEADRLLDLFR